MEKVPQIVAERLKGAVAVGHHPDADLLTAFSERSLSEGERTSVLEHLARCAECREIVALALPASEPVHQAIRPLNSGWLSWPVLRWGLIAAGIVAISSFGVVQYRHQHASTMTAYNVPRSQSLKKAEHATTLLPNASESSRNEDKAQSTATPDIAGGVTSDNVNVPGTPSPTVTSGVSGRVLQHGPKVQLQQNANQINLGNFERSQAAPPPIAKESPAVASASRVAPAPSSANGIGGGSGPSTGDAPVLESQDINRQSEQSGYAEAKVEKIKPAVTTFGGPSKGIVSAMQPPSAPAGSPMGRVVSSLGSSMRWTINSAGGLQRSADQGTTWQDVDVNKGAGGSSVSETSRAKTAKYDALDKQNTGAPIIFRAVAANGPDVWAGASGGLLYHSSDSGAHWARIVPSTSGISLTGDILTVEFIDVQHGRVTTSTPEIWTTSDAGHSWQKQ